MNGQRVRAVMAKDLREIGANPMVVIPMVIVPAVICVVIPTVILAVALGAGTARGVHGLDQVEKLIGVYPVPAALTQPLHRMLYVILNYTFLPMFMIVPLMMSSLISANAIVGEKERRTLETLLSTPLTNRELIVSKLLVSFLPAVTLSWAVFGAFFLVTNAVSLAMIHQWIVHSWIWLPSLLLLSPSVSMIALSLTLLVSLKARTFQSAQQVAALVVVPLVAVVFAQVTGAVILNVLYVVLASLVLFAAAAVLVLRVLPRFTREGIVSTL
ncbi:MAG TPA: ABC transporter permease subunit [Spirochaetia bacterium]|nr:ABC transporter permease subunit [Spirochaetia bacterium]